MKLKVVVKSESHQKGSPAIYANEVNGSNFKDIAIILNVQLKDRFRNSLDVPNVKDS